MSLTIYPLYEWWAFGSFLVFYYYEQCHKEHSVTHLVHMCTHYGIYPGVEMLGHNENFQRHQTMPKCFQNGCNHFHSLRAVQEISLVMSSCTLSHLSWLLMGFCTFSSVYWPLAYYVKSLFKALAIFLLCCVINLWFCVSYMYVANISYHSGVSLHSLYMISYDTSSVLFSRQYSQIWVSRPGFSAERTSVQLLISYLHLDV